MIRNDELQLRSVDVRYGAVQALRSISLDVRSNEIVALIGANGAGKTTLLRCIAGLEKAAAGTLRFGDVDLNGLPPHERVKAGIALAPEGRGIFPDQTVAHNLELGGYVLRKDSTALRRNTELVFALFPRLKERRAQMAGTMSGGEQQMLAIGRALMSEPRLLLLDEPSLGLAPLVIVEIFSAIQRLRAQGQTILIIEQMAQQALAIADRAYVLENGTITLEGTGSSLANDPKVRQAYLGMH